MLLLLEQKLSRLQVSFIIHSRVSKFIKSKDRFTMQFCSGMMMQTVPYGGVVGCTNAGR
jgi:hypothetical protein